MSDIVEKLEYKGKKIEICIDQDPPDPLDYDGNAVFVMFHKRYRFGSKDHDYSSSDFSSWDELENRILKDHKGAIILPIYMLDHSGITISTVDFNDHWDSGRVGVIYASPAMIKEWYGIKKITKAVREKAVKDLEAQVKNYDAYLRNEAYGYVIQDENGVELDSCFGFIGDIEYVKNEAKSVIDNIKPLARRP